jgi:ectoine hydroxylase-related dioxygenase (phytanoyl-CoA dioxygenase family)
VQFDHHYREQFVRQGFVEQITVKDSVAAASIRAQWNQLEQEEGFRSAGFSTTHSRHLDRRFAWDLATDPAILDSVEPLIGGDILLFGTRFFCKYGPDTDYFVDWHQDLDSWALEPPIAVTAWYAIDRSDEGNGCMQVIPGSHRDTGPRTHLLDGDTKNLLGRGQSLPIESDQAATAHHIVLEPGQISIHDGGLVHSSMPNRSDRRRCGLAIRYIPCHVRQDNALTKSPPSQAILVRGVDRFSHFGINPSPFV